MGDESFKVPLVEAFEVVLGPAKARLRAEREGERVKALVRQMGEYEKAERRLEQAQIAFGNGNTACLNETIIPPTPEQLAKGVFERFTADTVAGTARSATTVRRVRMGNVRRCYESGLIQQNALVACLWYRDVWEASGLTGNIPSTDYSKEVFSAPQSRSMFADWQIDMQDMLRTARAAITPRWVPFFEAVVLHEWGLQRAIKLSRARTERANGIFRDCCSELETAYETLKRN